MNPDRTRRAQDGVAEGNVLLDLAEGEAEAQLQRLRDDVDERLPGIAGELAAAVRAGRAPDGPPG